MAYKHQNGKLVRIGGNMRTHAFRPPVQPKAPKNKGQFKGLCNRSACLAPGADWYNRGSYAFYCGSCAHLLNDANKNDEFCRTGGPLCRRIDSAAEAKTLHVMDRSN